VNSFQVSPCVKTAKIHGVSLLRIEVPIMSLWRHRQDYVDSLKREIFFFLAPIAATGAMILLWFYG
jgi:hypothetical protein